MLVVLLLVGGAIVNVAVAWERNWELHGLIGCLDFLPSSYAWPGFAINTLFYAVILWMLFAAPFALRRWRRVKRGLCPACGYDLRGSSADVCPECGKPVKT